MKVAVIGGGSYLWSLGFARQFVNSACLSDLHLVLMDIDPDALELVGSAADLCNRTHGSTITIERTGELDPALDGADFVITSISTGGLDAMRHDLDVPEKYGIFHTVGDTVGPGGWLRAVRNIPVFDDFAARMKRLCPDAWLVNVTNPLTPLTRVPNRNYGIKTIGMCPGVDNAARSLANLAGADPGSRLDYVVTGVDHGSWFIRLSADGMDILQRLKELGYYRNDDQLPAQVCTDDPFITERNFFRAGFAVWHEIGYLPSISDRHTTENWPWFLTCHPETFPYGITRTSIESRQQWRSQAEKRLIEYVHTGDDEKLGALGHGDDPVVDVIESLSGCRSFLYTANYMNIGQISGIPDGAVVETRCLYDAAGVHPLCSPMPDVLKSLVLPHIFRQEAIIDVALTGAFDELVALVLTDPLCCRLSISDCREMVSEMLYANRGFIRNPKLLDLGRPKPLSMRRLYYNDDFNRS